MGHESGNFGDFEIREAPRSHEEVAIYNEIQAILIGRSMAPDEDLDAHAQSWIDANSENFSLVFDELKAENPNLLEDWVNDRESVLAQIQERMSQLVNR